MAVARHPILEELLLVGLEFLNHLAGGGVPELERLVDASGNHLLAVRAESDTVDRLQVHRVVRDDVAQDRRGRKIRFIGFADGFWAVDNGRD